MIKKYWMKIEELGIAKKLLLWLLIVALLPIICIVIIAYSLTNTTIRNQTGELIEANLELTTSNVRNFFEAYDRIIQQVYTDSSYIENLQPINQWNSFKYDMARHQMNEMFQSIIYTNKEILGIAIVGKNGDIAFYDSISNSELESFCFDLKNLRNSELIKLVSSKKGTVYSKTFHKMRSEYGDKDFFYIAHQLTDFNNYQKGPVGSMILCIDESALKEVYSYESTEASITFIVNGQGDLISFPERKRIGENIFHTFSGEPAGKAAEEKKGVLPQTDAASNETPYSEEEILKNATDYIGQVHYTGARELRGNIRSIKEGEFYVINVQNMRYALENVRRISGIIILIGLLAAILCILVSIHFSEGTDRSVKRILGGMDETNRGNRKARIKVEGKDEFSLISHHFNQMMDEIQKKEELEKEALTREKNAEIKSLEAQINPHFLYNTLDAINWVAIEQEEYSISKMLTSLAKILRYSIHRSNEVVMVKEEMEYLKNYIYLQQQRYNYSFFCTVEVEEELLSSKIHKLLIQPLLENALVHAFPGKTGMDEVNIIMRRAGDHQMQILIRDNGKGMDPALTELLNHFDYHQERIESSIGVRNVITRVKLYYGSSGQFHAESGEDGTRIELTVPYED